MTSEEIKAEILEIIETLPEEALIDVLNYLRKLQENLEREKTDELVNKIISDNYGLFKRLANS